MIDEGMVVAVHPERRTVDVVLLHNARRLAEVKVSSGVVSSDSGEWRMPSVPKPSNETAASGLTPGRNLVAIVQWTSMGRPIVTGFYHPEGGMMKFTEQDLEVDRHPSGAYEARFPDGSREAVHPSGGFIRWGTGAAQVDLTPLSADKNWKPPSGGANPTLTLSFSGHTIQFNPGGTFAITSSGTGEWHHGGLEMWGDVKQHGTFTTDDMIFGSTPTRATTHDHPTSTAGTPTGPPVPGS